jgi:hypothetical protein
MEGNKISIKRIIGNVIGNLRLKNVNSVIDDFARWALEAENFIGTANSYIHKECLIQFKGMRAYVPEDVIYINALKYNNYQIELTNKNFTMFNKGASNGGSKHLANVVSARLNTGVTSQVKGSDGVGYNEGNEYVGNNIVFSIKNRYIYVNSKSIEEVGISYEGIALDEEGWPEIAESHEQAVQAYLIWQYKFADYVDGKIPNHVYVTLERRWYDLCGQARGDDELPSPSELEYLGNMMNQLMPLPNKKFF